MPTPVDQMTHEERCLWLAEQTEPCLHHDTSLSDPYGEECAECHGTRMEPRYPMLRRRCPHLDSWAGGTASILEELHHEATGLVCRGWLTVTTTEALLEAGRSLGHEAYRACLEALLDWDDEMRGGGKRSKEEALSLALVQVEAAKKEASRDH